MSLSKFVKISHVSNLSDARYCAGMMVDVLGFDLSNKDSEHYVDPVSFREITEWIAGVEYAGEFYNSDYNVIKDCQDSYDVQYIETSTLSILTKLAEGTGKLIYRVAVTDQAVLASLADILNQADAFADIIIVESSSQDLNSAILDTIGHLKLNAKMLKGYNLSVEEVADLPSFWSGIELKGSVEKQPGFKDFDEIMDILEALEID